MARKEYKCEECGRTIYYKGVCYKCRQREEREGYEALSEAEAAAKIDAIIEAIDDGFYDSDEAYDFSNLLAYRGVSTEKLAEAAAQAGVYYPCEIYLDASAEARAKLIALLMAPECPEANHILQCLAIAGGDDVLEAFIELEKSPRPWAGDLHVPPSVYAQAGGWTFDEAGARIELNYGQCFPVFEAHPGEKGKGGDKGSAVSAATPREDVCPVCGGNLTDILVIDGNDERLAFLGLPGIVKIPICPMCATLCERTIVRYTPDGDSVMELVKPYQDCSRMPDSEYAAMTANKFELASAPVPVFFSHGADESAITIGGFANWIQDFQYDACPDCGKTMRYFASVPWSALSDFSEGTLYLEICPDCRVISVIHQQT